MEFVDACLLLDFYGQLLTERTRMVLEMHFSEDMSFSEIAEQEGISRQAIHDTIRRGLSSLEEYEKKLGLIRRFSEQKSTVRQAVDAMDKNNTAHARELLAGLYDIL